jgi:hypothetical protein
LSIKALISCVISSFGRPEGVDISTDSIEYTVEEDTNTADEGLNTGDMAAQEQKKEC